MVNRRYLTPRRAQLPRPPDSRPFVPMRRGGLSLIDLPMMLGLLALVRWVGTHMHNLTVVLALLAAAGAGLGVLSGYLAVRRHAHRSRPMVGPSDDQPFA